MSERKPMPINVQRESSNIYRMQISGVLRKSELDKVQALAAEEITRSGGIRLLFVLDQFQGWEKGADWSDLSFYLEHGDDIEKIAIVCDEKFRDGAMAFAGAGMRKGEVRYFSP